jgi:tmRNA-binding protein
MCPLENQSSAKDLQQSLVQKSNEYKLAYIGTVYFILKSDAKYLKENRAYKRNQRKKRKYLLHQSILLKLIFSYHSKSLIENQIPLNTL